MNCLLPSRAATTACRPPNCCSGSRNRRRRRGRKPGRRAGCGASWKRCGQPTGNCSGEPKRPGSICGKGKGGWVMPGEKIKPVGEYNTEGYARVTASSTDALLPSLTDTYKAAGFSEEVSCLVLIMGAPGFKPGGTAYVTLQYVHIGLGEFGF